MKNLKIFLTFVMCTLRALYVEWFSFRFDTESPGRGKGLLGKRSKLVWNIVELFYFSSKFVGKFFFVFPLFLLARFKFPLVIQHMVGNIQKSIATHTHRHAHTHTYVAHMCRPFQVQIQKATATTTMAKSLILIWLSLRATKQNPKNAVKKFSL